MAPKEMKQLLRTFFATLAITGVVLLGIGLWFVHQYDTNKYGIINCRGGFAHCVRLHPQGVVYEWGGLITMIGVITVGVALVSLIVLALTKVRK